MSKILRDARSRDETIVMEERIYITLPREEDHSFHLTGKVRLVCIKQLQLPYDTSITITQVMQFPIKIIKLHICNVLYKVAH